MLNWIKMERLTVLKTYKLYIGGAFPRTESGRYYEPIGQKGQKLGNICLSSRKDLRNAVVAARKALGGWSERTHFNRGQILYRIAEMLETRSTQFIEEIQLQGKSEKAARQEFELAVDRLVYYAGWCDKYTQILSSVNPVASSHFNFSTVEPVGVVGVLLDERSALINLVSIIAPIIAGGNTLVVLAPESKPLSAITFAEVLNSSDLPGGVVNILTGKLSELLKHVAGHMDINAITYSEVSLEQKRTIETLAVDNLKRTREFDLDWLKKDSQGLQFIDAFQEVKTTWHPIENIGGASSTY
jgi:acyl-CoA reductase-like NAD-dependent aldehyde dehydrogenase